MSNDILIKRERVRNEMSKIVSLDRVNPNDIFDILKIYDTVFFDGELELKLKELLFKMMVKFTDEIDGISVMTVEENSIVLFYNQSKIQNLDFLKKLGCNDYIECLQILIEHDLIHLIQLLWGEESQYPHDSLFYCLSVEFFGKHIKRPVFEKGKVAGFKWYADSCYIDSLLMIMLRSCTIFWLDALSSPIQYDTVQGICDTESSIKTVKDLTKLASEMRDQIFSDYKSIIEKNSPKVCTDLRKLLATCLPDMKIGKYYNVATAYDLICSIFPKAKIYYMTSFEGGTDLKSRAAFSMWEFMESPQKDIPQIDWRSIGEIIAFYNTGSPRIQNFADTSPEGKIEKFRTFGNIILDQGNDFYMLIGCILLSGVGKTGGGSHYMCYYLGGTSVWYFYDDLKGYAQPQNYPDSIFTEKNGIMPAMYFYKRMKKKEIIMADDYSATIIFENLHYTITIRTYKDMENFYLRFRKYGKEKWIVPIGYKEKFLLDLKKIF